MSRDRRRVGTERAERSGRMGSSRRHDRDRNVDAAGRIEDEEREQQTMGRSSATLPKPRRTSSSPAARSPPQGGPSRHGRGIVVAFILALVVRGFEAQAFVIPTGSMAPTLMGRHKEIACPQCGFVYAVNASEEVESRCQPTRRSTRASASTAGTRPALGRAPSFKGDRILVMMFPYDLPFLPGQRPPERWDVVVFRYPEEPEVSYIKRLVGLPGETIRIDHGDIYVKAPGSDALHPGPQAARAPVGHADQRLRRPPSPPGPGRSARVDPVAERGRRLEVGRVIGEPLLRPRQSRTTPGPSCATTTWSPTPSSGTRSSTTASCPVRPAPTLVTDFYSYNTNLPGRVVRTCSTNEPRRPGGAWMQPHWVGDLTLAADDRGAARSIAGRFGPVRAGQGGDSPPLHDRPGDGRGDAHPGRRGPRASATTPIKGPGRYHVEFANVDDRLTLVVDGQPVGDRVHLRDGEDRSRSRPRPTWRRRPSPCGMRRSSASDLVLKRDIYYTQYPGRVRLWSGLGRSLARGPRSSCSTSSPTRRGSRAWPR